RMVLHVEQGIAPTTISPASLSTIYGYTDYTLVIAKDIIAGKYLAHYLFAPHTHPVARTVLCRSRNCPGQKTQDRLLRYGSEEDGPCTQKPPAAGSMRVVRMCKTT